MRAVGTSTGQHRGRSGGQVQLRPLTAVPAFPVIRYPKRSRLKLPASTCKRRLIDAILPCQGRQWQQQGHVELIETLYLPQSPCCLTLAPSSWCLTSQAAESGRLHTAQRQPGTLAPLHATHSMQPGQAKLGGIQSCRLLNQAQNLAAVQRPTLSQLVPRGPSTEGLQATRAHA